MSFPVSKSNLKRARKPRGSKNLKGFKPQLTSLVDLMTVIVVYLVQSFSTGRPDHYGFKRPYAPRIVGEKAAGTECQYHRHE